MIWKLHHKRMTPEMLGYVPTFFDEEDPRRAAEQIRDRYIGGWAPLSGFVMLPDGTLLYGDQTAEDADPPLQPLASADFRHERLVFYPHAWLAIVQPDGSYEVSRVD